MEKFFFENFIASKKFFEALKSFEKDVANYRARRKFKKNF